MSTDSIHSGGALVAPCTLAYLLTMACSVANADTIGLVDGQAYERSQFRKLTLDASARTQADSRRAGVRLTFPALQDQLVLFLEAEGSRGELGDLAVMSDVEFGGDGEGAGFFYTGLPDWKNFKTTLRVSYNREENSVDTVIAIAGQQATVDYDQRNIAAGLIFSPKTPMMDNGINGYLTLGAVSQRSRRHVFANLQMEPSLSRDSSDIYPYFAAGAVYPYKRLHFYAVTEYQQQLSVSLGLRWAVKAD